MHTPNARECSRSGIKYGKSFHVYGCVLCWVGLCILSHKCDFILNETQASWEINARDKKREIDSSKEWNYTNIQFNSGYYSNPVYRMAFCSAKQYPLTKWKLFWWSLLYFAHNSSFKLWIPGEWALFDADTPQTHTARATPQTHIASTTPLLSYSFAVIWIKASGFKFLI